MRSRAVLLPHPADPFMLKYWLKFYNEVWGGEIDKLYILINSPMEFDVVKYMIDLVARDDKIRCDYITRQIEHGAAIDEMLTYCHEDYVMLVEDDGYIFKPGVINYYFNLLETNEYDVIGSPRGSCSMEIWDRSKELWNLDYSGYGDVGPNFWPNYFFTRRGILEKTDRNFGARSWKKGERIEPLDYVVQEEVCASDTFVNTSLQLRAENYKIKTIPQYHASPDDLEHFKKKRFLFDGKAPWTHIGSLSSGTHGVLIDDFGRPLARRSIDPPKDTARVPGQCNTLQEQNEWERRVVFWSMFLDNSDPNEIPEFRREYEKAINRVITQFHLSQQSIAIKKAIYRSIGL